MTGRPRTRPSPRPATPPVARPRRRRPHPAPARAHARACAPSRASGSQAPLGTVLPAVTCAAQSTFLTGTTPSEHGIVGNGWYFRELGDVLLWRQHNGLVAGDKLWDAARRAHPGYTVANICWWYAMGADTDLTVTPRPVYYADGRKEPDCYTRPPDAARRTHRETRHLPPLPLLGPGRRPRLLAAGSSTPPAHILRHPPPRPDPRATSRTSTTTSSATAPTTRAPTGRPPTSTRAVAPLLDDARAEGRTVVALSEYGITRVDRPVDINRALRRAGLLEVHTQDGMEYLDPMASRAFAVADHQIAHVYVRRPEDLDATREPPSRGPARHRRTPRRRGQEGRTASTTRAPANWSPSPSRTPGSRTTTGSTTPAPPTSPSSWRSTANPATTRSSCSWTPTTPTSRSRRRAALARKKLGLRYRMAVVPLDPSPIRGSHGRLPASDDDGPLLLCSTPRAVGGRVAATEVKSLLLRLAGLT